jgi:hypothetical protein
MTNTAEPKTQKLSEKTSAALRRAASQADEILGTKSKSRPQPADTNRNSNTGSNHNDNLEVASQRQKNLKPPRSASRKQIISSTSGEESKTSESYSNRRGASGEERQWMDE